MMGTVAILRLLPLGCLLLACSGGEGSDGASVDPDAVCDGGEGLALAFATFPTHPLPATEAFVTRNGYRYLYIDRTCSYWVNSVPTREATSNSELQHAVSGQLSVSELRELLTDVGYAGWGKLAGPSAEVHAYDASMWVLTDGTHFVQCLSACRDEGRSVSPQRTAALEAAKRWADRLEKAPSSAVVAGAARVVVMDWTSAEPNYMGGAADWPLEQPLDDFLLELEGDYWVEPRRSRVEPPAVDVLRSLRERQVAGELKQWWLTGGPSIPVRVPGRPELFNLTVSDELPFERPEGGVAIWNLPEDEPLAP